MSPRLIDRVWREMLLGARTTGDVALALHISRKNAARVLCAIVAAGRAKRFTVKAHGIRKAWYEPTGGTADG